MPCRVKPKTLQDLCVAKVGCLIFDSWVAVERKYGANTAAEWPAGQLTEVAGLQSFLLSHIRPLMDEVCDAMCRVHVIPNQAKGEKCHRASKDIRILLSLMIHNGMKVLRLGHEFDKRLFLNASLSDSQIKRLGNLLELDIPGVPLTNEMLKGIGRTCERLEKIVIACDRKYVVLESLRGLLKCTKLEYVEIIFLGWKGSQFRPYIAMLLTGLPNLKVYNNVSLMEMDKILCKLPSATSLEELDLGAVIAKDFARIIEKCPRLKHLKISTMNYSEGCDSLVILGKSSLHLETICFETMRFESYMISLLELKGGNLTKLVLDDCEGPEYTIADVCAIGANCPKLRHLAIFESRRGKYIRDPPERCRLSGAKRKVVKRPRMFSDLVFVELCSAGGWDFRVALQILMNADRIETVGLLNVFANGSLDILAEMLEANPLSELESLSVEAEGWFVEANPQSPLVSRRSIKRLMDRCPKLGTVRLSLPLEPEAVVYVEQLKAEVRTENLDLAITYVDPAHSSDDESEGFEDPDDSSGHEDNFQGFLEKLKESIELALL